MGVFVICSTHEATGKTAVCAGLAVNFAREGKKVGYFRLPAPQGVDGDTAFMKKALGIEDGMSPEQMMKGKDVVLVEARLGHDVSSPESRLVLENARRWQAKVIAVEACSEGGQFSTDVCRTYGSLICGLILNRVPASKLGEFKKQASLLEREGIRLLGIIPESRSLLAITVGEIAGLIGGKILNSAEKAEELVENYMLGAMVVDSGREYFARRQAKAVVLRHDRADMQLAALETPTTCLVLGGSQEPPFHNVAYQAQLRGVPVITSALPVPEIVKRLEAAVLGGRLRQAGKLPRLGEIVRQGLLFPLN
ncbi:MAG: AAA family ATPase [Dehalococcoidales bacterium]|nr:AAA family ATPase [Dehalococcoidales bacterium]